MVRVCIWGRGVGACVVVGGGGWARVYIRNYSHRIRSVSLSRSCSLSRKTVGPMLLKTAGPMLPLTLRRMFGARQSMASEQKSEVEQRLLLLGFIGC